MKWFLSGIVLVALTSSTCNKAAKSKTCFKARLEVKGICMNYTFTLLEGDTSVMKVVHKWVDENTSKTYYSAFALGNPCGFADLKEGEEFYFVADADAQVDCATCKAYYPTPPVRNNIKVVAKCP
jgi:hypothetical protein